MISKTEFPTSVEQIEEIHKAQQLFYKTKSTLSIATRRGKLQLLKEILLKYEVEICDALYADFKKPLFESQITEYILVLREVKRALDKLNTWTKPKRVRSSIVNFPSRSKIIFDPYGNTLIIAPWNYPFQLIMAPLIAAVAAGNTVTLKPSELTPNTSKLVAQLISEVFESKYVAVVQGGVEQSQKLLSLRWDYIFFTGSPKVGQIVYEAAAKYLTPVTLELGGKNPCIVDNTTPLKLAAKRIVWGKFVNAGQTCIAPDYLLVNETVKAEFLTYLKDEIIRAYGQNAQESPDFPRIINKSNFERLEKLIDKDCIVHGGYVDKTDLFIAPTVLDFSKKISNQDLQDLPNAMQDEIFGPVLPVIGYSNISELNDWIEKFEKPLALYIFSKNNQLLNHILTSYSFGGGAVNDVVIQFTNDRLPFGGVGKSGIGAYHGYRSFETFSHKKSIVTRGTWLDIPFRYAPYLGKTKWIKKLNNWI
ncbi:aldehyde dehydrogenase [Leeuwenhoekiella sp. W20_SRS_FM14]|uniref:aldehyde dehydrogenase n=1 Tax=Leeuwenhoekiella sp. W20_SRS_FM14 TaxID=3240270 RepID=UPI003F9784C7